MRKLLIILIMATFMSCSSHRHTQNSYYSKEPNRAKVHKIPVKPIDLVLSFGVLTLVLMIGINKQLTQ